MKLIDADALKASIEEKDRYNLGGEGRIVVCGMLDDAPTVDAELVKHGRWRKRMSTPDSLKCTVCGNSHEYETTYCPNCGAKMDGGAE